MNMMKKNGGFTLVELIVVIAILAILAGIAVPAYSGYIAKANEAKDVTQLDAIKTAAVFVANEKCPGTTVSEIIVSKTGAVTVDYSAVGSVAAGNDEPVDVSGYVGTINFASAKYQANGAKWTTAAGWAANS